ncbi:glutamate cyclase, mitochondrial [Seminavis robusta]|uniref:Glutamate cyclase, mitochondrial n=1 Tax=Seminavis robusta TaxID=568900 RepID=A0A9N8E7U4_9STRA|nr:glutamate cyclase, mitochondrial [Seminavis robusta]|eukprot:Sro716_g191830.1 glutamate cyclase, mitochondrial (323) ;mRNA; r:4623-5591
MAEAKIGKIQDIIGTDAGDRGMKSLIVPGDLLASSRILAALPASSTVLVLSGFPCCVKESPPTETDGPPGAYAIARAAMALGHTVIVVTDDCNQAVFAAGLENLALPSGDGVGSVTLQCFPAKLNDEQQQQFDALAASANLVIACERAGPGADGNCYTMRGIDMTSAGLIAPLDELIASAPEGVPFLAIGDGGNEMGMGKVIDKIKENPKIQNGDKIGCVVPADHLVAASVSNWGGYALAAGAAIMKAATTAEPNKESSSVQDWIQKCLPTDQQEVELLARCVAAGCRDGVSGKMESTVDGMPLETSLQCLRDIRNAALGGN